MHYSSLITADNDSDALPPSPHLCESGVAPALTHQQPHAVVSLVSSSVTWPDWTAPSCTCCSLIASQLYPLIALVI